MNVTLVEVLYTHVPVIRVSSAYLATLLPCGGVSEVRFKLTSGMWDRCHQELHMCTTPCLWRPDDLSACVVSAASASSAKSQSEPEPRQYTCCRSMAMMQWPGFWSVLRQHVP